MRQTPIRANRTGLMLTGLVLLLAGLLTVGLGTGVIQSLAGGGSPPARGDAVRDALPGDQVALAVALLGGLLAAVLGIAWLIRQVPRRGAATSFRLHDSASAGLTTLPPAALMDAVREHAETLPGVTKANAVIRGSARSPELTLAVHVDDRADIADVVAHTDSVVADGVRTALDTELAYLGVQIHVDRGARTHDTIAVAG